MKLTLIDSNPEIGNEAQDFSDPLIGKLFGRLTPVRLVPKKKHIYYYCKCTCGGDKLARKYALLSGKLKSCGCIGRERPHAYKHGLSSTEKNHGRLHMYYAAKARAKKAGFAFTIELNDIKIPNICPVLGIPLFFGSGCCSDNSPSLDQIIAGAGYTPDNIQVVSHRANTAKNCLSFDEFEKLYLYWKNQRERLKREASENDEAIVRANGN